MKDNKLLNPQPLVTKMCWWCEHFYYLKKEDDWSDVTPGAEFTIGCSKSHWVFDPKKDDQEKFGECLSTAINCDEFKKKD